MNKNIKTLEEKLKTGTGESDLPIKTLKKEDKKKIFDSSKFTKLADELKKIFREDEQYPNSAVKSV